MARLGLTPCRAKSPRAPCARRRKQREQKQYSKQIQAERLKEKAQAKKKQIADVSKLRKQREKSVGAVCMQKSR